MWAAGMIAVMVGIECMEAGSNTLSKAAMTNGMSDYVFVVYSNSLALLFILPSTLIYHRKRPCPKLTFLIVCRIFIVGLLSCTLQILMYIGIGYSSPTMASAMNSLIPAFTFILALVTRMEKLDLKVQSSQAKSIGTILSITGAYIVVFYQGPPILFSRPLPNLHSFSVSLQSNWIVGGFLLATSSFLISLLYIVQTWIIKDYPAEMVVTLFGCIFVTILSAIVALIVERDPNAWTLKPDVELITIVYSGPVFVSTFRPLGMAFAVFMGVTFLKDTLHIGSVIGAVIIALGLYAVMWGKANEVQIIEENVISRVDSSSDKVPLLQNKSMEV
ncbi:WAT1-related protein At3g28050-like isoform X2 [Camellia sinensis]|uniref:WAT1-related protein At3g28050-like isoform X2 n=1 Tax=Camellia sinensis TaxID=4442 RepID=UPI001036E088|nr:WAT1-related protein At3g28050-like isoform X2 [Camellia sinensis]